jgi:hypothetical protein
LIAIGVERLDLVSVPTRDLARSRRFYDLDGNVLIVHRRYAPLDR